MNRYGLAGRIAHTFIDSKLTPLVTAASVLLGVFAVIVLPREEEPQIVVPMADVFVQMPGASAKEVEDRVVSPMEKLLWEIPGVEYIYSTSSPGVGMAVVRFRVGEDLEKSLVKFYNKLYSNFDRIPPGASEPLIKPRSIDDVPILALTLWSSRYDGFMLRRIAAQVETEIKSVEDVSETAIIGGQRRQIRVLLDAGRMAGHGVAPASILGALDAANRQAPAGSFKNRNAEVLVEAGALLKDAEDVGRVVVGVSGDRPVHLRDVAVVEDGPEEPATYTFFGAGATAAQKGIRTGPGEYPAVTISMAKRKGTNAIVVADRVMEKVSSLKGRVLTQDVNVTVTRNYGETANEKSNELLEHMMNEAIRRLQVPEGYEIERYTARQPFTTGRIAMKWDGEWHITYEVFRDLGLAFGAVLVLIYILVVAWFQSFRTPVVIMSPIPLTLIGILPAHALLGAFFTATSMIGFIAGAGIIVRNSIILVDFIELRLRQGMPLKEAVVDAGAVRFRPMLLTAAAVIAGSFVILFDPIFQGLAVALMAGEVASTLLSRMAVPVLYYVANRKTAKPILPQRTPRAQREEVEHKPCNPSR